MLAQITTPGRRCFCAGIVLRGDTVQDAAPIVAYMVGWTRDRVRSYVTKRGWSIRVVHSALHGQEKP